jgi:hypothetical protein
LAADFIIGRSVGHWRQRSRDARSVRLDQSALAVRRPRYILESYPLFG